MTCWASNITSEFGESTEDDHLYKGILNLNAIASITSILIALIAILGNTAVITVFFWNEALRIQRGNILIVYLAMTDVMTALFVMIPSAIAVFCGYWPFGKIVCKINATFNYAFFCSSSVNISLISIDRLIAVVFPLRYTAWMTKRLMMCFCGCLFLQSFLVGLNTSIPDWITYNSQEGFCAVNYYGDYAHLRWLAMPASVLCYMVPAVIMGVCNVIIIVTANRSENTAQALFIRRANLATKIHMRKTIKSLLYIVLAYYVCYSPFCIVKVVKIFTKCEIPPWFEYIIRTLYFMASATNPFIYAIFRNDYREAFKKLLKVIVGNCAFFVGI